jgi:hypothetical protein
VVAVSVAHKRVDKFFKAFFVGVIRFEPALDLLNRGIEFRRDRFQIGAFGMPQACYLLAVVSNDVWLLCLLDPKRLGCRVVLIVVLGIGKRRELKHINEPREAKPCRVAIADARSEPRRPPRLLDKLALFRG